MTRRKQEGPLEGAFLLAHPCCTFTPASRCTIAPALTQLVLELRRRDIHCDVNVSRPLFGVRNEIRPRHHPASYLAPKVLP